MTETPADGSLRWPSRLYNRTVLQYPWFFLAVFIGLAVFFAFQLRHFKMDASSDSIVLENDKDLKYYDQTRQIFGSDDYVVLTVTPPGDLFDQETLDALESLVAELEQFSSVESVTSILSVPLFHSPDVPLFRMATDYKTLGMEETDLDLAREEFITSPLYSDYLISKNAETSAVQVNFKVNEELTALENRRYELREKRREEGLTEAEEAELEEVEQTFADLQHKVTEERQEDIESIREIIARYEAGDSPLGKIHLGGVPMIVADIIEYVEKDIVNFLIGVFAFIVVMLALIYRKPKWVILPAGTCAVVVVIMMGYLGLVDWRTTIVTSNFSSILLVQTMAMAIHIAVRYQEFYSLHPEWDNRSLVLHSVSAVAKPCFFTAFTTIVGFGSLIVSGIRPVMDFGLMMAMGLTVAYIACFILLPAALVYFPKGFRLPKHYGELNSPLVVFARFTEKFKWSILLGTLALLLLCFLGITRLTVENRFIDYFKRSSEIYSGMTVIDNRLGGTTPLEVVLDGNEPEYWLNEEHLAKLEEIHNWLDEQPETGKVISPVTMLRMLEKINQDKPVGITMLRLIKGRIPEDIAKAVLQPYVTPDFSTVRIAMRVRESDRNLVRKELMQRIRNYLENESGMPPGTTHVTGVFVLYNNMLQSLFTSQILTIGAVIAAIWVVFVLLFRSFVWATIAIIPNVMPVILVLGTLGWLNIPLDMMTIMIAAVTFGIAVDDTIHYIHRFREEFPVDHDYIATMHRCHSSIGRAIVHTSITIIFGFSVLTLSNFKPTIYFGLFTGLAMVMALFSALVLLPLIIQLWKPKA